MKTLFDFWSSFNLREIYKPYTIGHHHHDFYPYKYEIKHLINNNVENYYINETENERIYHILIPGISKEEIKINLKNSEFSNNDILEIHRIKNKEENNKFDYLLDRLFFEITDDLDKEQIHASSKDGILTISIKKKSKEQQKINKTIKEIKID